MTERNDTQSTTQRTDPIEDSDANKQEIHSAHYDSTDIYYRCRSPSCSDETDEEDDPYQELFMNAWRSAPASSDEEDEPVVEFNQLLHPDAKPFSLMDDSDLWDYMDESELKERLKNQPRLLEEITRKRKRRMLDDEYKPDDDDLTEVLDRFVKYVRTEPTNIRDEWENTSHDGGATL
ncbi:uncharacterized protein LOC131210807 [Anopheles bellator]|uniref:uncharacterized protein LOC131210807 n=1 Tax=Anopheles bellator TaxID=139047 RepID=UPI0026489E52|nr:uncharacterized protein LOC131210807 [Anopheles bellator]